KSAPRPRDKGTVWAFRVLPKESRPESTRFFTTCCAITEARIARKYCFRFFKEANVLKSFGEHLIAPGAS
ncbi:MAG TPA: hypothetical protein VJS64_04285, partial [Pyrinomonadaceae bacterium]|nr:hypothetical protein [Pyrinomonadaceae bacterium]